MSNRTVPTAPTLSRQDLDDLVRGALERALDSRLTALAAGLAGVEGRLALADQRIALVDQRVAQLSLPEQLQVITKLKAAMEQHLREGVMQLEWFAAMAKKVRELYSDIADDNSPKSDGLPTVSDLSALINGTPTGQAPEGDGIPAELRALFTGMAAPKK